MKTLLFVYFALMIITLTSCKQSGGGEATVSGMNAQCVANPSSCNSSLYQQSQGYQPYSYSNGYTYNNGNGYNYNNQYSNNPFYYSNNTAYLCNCPIGTMPTYNSYAGLGCVRSASAGFKSHLFVGYFYLGWGNNQWYGTTQLNTYSSNRSNCYSGAIQSCVLAMANGCPTGYMCRPSAANASLGLCVASRR